MPICLPVVLHALAFLSVWEVSSSSVYTGSSGPSVVAGPVSSDVHGPCEDGGRNVVDLIEACLLLFGELVGRDYEEA